MTRAKSMKATYIMYLSLRASLSCAVCYTRLPCVSSTIYIIYERALPAAQVARQMIFALVPARRRSSLYCCKILKISKTEKHILLYFFNSIEFLPLSVIGYYVLSTVKKKNYWYEWGYSEWVEVLNLRRTIQVKSNYLVHVIQIELFQENRTTSPSLIIHARWKYSRCFVLFWVKWKSRVYIPLS